MTRAVPLQAMPLLVLTLFVTACGGSVGTDADSSATTSAATTSPVTTGPASTGAVTTSPVTTSPVGDTTLPSANLDLAGTERPADVVDVIDGDSLVLRADGDRIEVRLDGINAPESDECHGSSARDGLLEILDGGPVSLIETGRDQFGRTLGYVLVGDDVANLAQVVRGNALATASDHEAVDAFLRAEEQAFSVGRGMWAAEACGPSAGARIGVARVDANPPGPDDERLLDEWVGFVNDGDTVELSGWTVRDESSTHRYVFAEGTTVLAGDAFVLRTGCGSDGAREFHWCADGPVWSNGGDTVLLLDESGNVVDRFRYEG